MKQKFFVPYETAQALKAAGYNEKVNGYYTKGKDDTLCIAYCECLLNNTDQVYYGDIAAPTYHEVVDWLEENGVKVWAEWIGDDWCGVCVWSSARIRYTNHYGSREEALNATILAVLEMEVAQ